MKKRAHRNISDCASGYTGPVSMLHSSLSFIRTEPEQPLSKQSVNLIVEQYLQTVITVSLSIEDEDR
ncbi:unnamed protein product [Sphenostylis stenocarpa]|uniref:Uncharacterized protein n=1 Tax=Sphenostylis stenocarpa TaxID=92480 RepID=A0AA86S346_9FABA|nr:unnamed protein product [Sphenostylis stenocarpa]